MRTVGLIACAAFLCAFPAHAFAYVGPGLGAGALAAVLGVAGGLVMLIVGVIWYPIKRILRRIRPGK